MSLYDDLGVPKDADAATIRRAFRKKAQKLHPDRDGGDPEQFALVAAAWGILGDEKKRARYDETGDATQQQSVAVKIVAERTLGMLDTVDPDTVDLMALVLQSLRKEIEGGRQFIRDAEKIIARRERAAKRVKRTTPGENMIAAVLAGDIAARRRGIAGTLEQIETFEEACRIVEEYRYAFEPMQMVNVMGGAFYQPMGQRGPFG